MSYLLFRLSNIFYYDSEEEKCLNFETFNFNYVTKYELLAALLMTMPVFWDVTLCIFTNLYEL
jgi:hypothetical protein